MSYYINQAGVLDPSKSIVNTGSWIGDNALPWALLLEQLNLENPGKVIAIDPSEQYVTDMVDLANVNGIGNLCSQIGVLSSNTSKIAYFGTSTEHIKVETEERTRRQHKASWLNAITLDSFNLQKSVSLIHLDVEGHEAEVLKGAKATIQASRPIIITEGYDKWPDPEDVNDKAVMEVLSELG